MKKVNLFNKKVMSVGLTASLLFSSVIATPCCYADGGITLDQNKINEEYNNLQNKTTKERTKKVIKAIGVAAAVSAAVYLGYKYHPQITNAVKSFFSKFSSDKNIPSLKNSESNTTITADNTINKTNNIINEDFSNLPNTLKNSTETLTNGTILSEKLFNTDITINTNPIYDTSSALVEYNAKTPTSQDLNYITMLPNNIKNAKTTLNFEPKCTDLAVVDNHVSQSDIIFIPKTTETLTNVNDFSEKLINPTTNNNLNTTFSNFTTGSINTEHEHNFVFNYKKFNKIKPITNTSITNDIITNENKNIGTKIKNIFKDINEKLINSSKKFNEFMKKDVHIPVIEPLINKIFE